jgi:hypothetical protein
MERRGGNRDTGHIARESRALRHLAVRCRPGGELRLCRFGEMAREMPDWEVVAGADSSHANFDPGNGAELDVRP